MTRALDWAIWLLADRPIRALVLASDWWAGREARRYSAHANCPVCHPEETR